MRADKIDGTILARLLKQALAWLQENREEINALNIFPVPDGDTGTNMCATLEAAVAAIGDPAPHSIDLVAAAAARGALIGGRGNSGVILSQIIHGFAAALKGKKTAGA
ncbi:DAK2 domain-containing protein [Thermodesulfitimonas sp.]